MGSRFVQATVCLALLLLAFLLSRGSWWPRDVPSSEDANKPDDAAPVAESAPGIEPYLQRLTDSGWSDEAARAVVTVNAEWFQIQSQENPVGLELQLRLLADLGRHPELHGLLVEHPEIASLLAGAENPHPIADTLRLTGHDYNVVTGLYVLHADPQAAAELAEALNGNRELICRMYRHGALAAEALFLFDRSQPGAAEYEQWLRELLQVQLATASDEELASLINLIFVHGPGLRERMRTNPEFRQRFADDYWPRFVNAVLGRGDNGQGIGAFEHYLGEKRLWDLLALEEGAQLLEHTGLFAIDLLYGRPEIGQPAYPEELHGRIIQILLQRREKAIRALFEFRGQPLFRDLLKRNLSEEAMFAALGRLLQAKPNHAETLKLFARLDDGALAEEVGPPPDGLITWVPLYYTVYEVPKKLMQGRQPTGMELFSAVSDPVFLVIDVFTAGQSAPARKVLLGGSKELAEQSSKKLAERGARNLAQKGWDKPLVTTLRHTGLELAKKRGGTALAQMTDEELVQWSVTSLISQMLTAVRSTLNRATTFEITRPVQFLFRYSGVKGETIKRLTGLEARLFMRGDARVFVRVMNVPVAVLGARSVNLLSQTAEDISINMVADSDLAEAVVAEAKEQAVLAAEQLQAWRQNVSAWWLLNASASRP